MLINYNVNTYVTKLKLSVETLIFLIIQKTYFLKRNLFLKFQKQILIQI